MTIPGCPNPAGNHHTTKGGQRASWNHNIMIPIYKDWHPNAPIGSKWFWKWDNNPAAWDNGINPTNGICDYDTGSGLKQKTRLSRVEISMMWGDPAGNTPDGKTFKDWNENPKDGGYYDAFGVLLNGSPGTYFFPQTTQSYYKDGNNVDWQVFFNYTAKFGDCGGSPCPDGETWNDVIDYLRENGYDGDGPAMNLITPISSDTAQYGVLMDFYHGNTGQMAGGNHNPSWTVFAAYQHVNSDVANPLNISYSGFPEVTTNDTYEELFAKLTNNSYGWTIHNHTGDVAQMPTVHWVEEPCVCDTLSIDAECVQDIAGIYNSMVECQSCVTCDCHTTNQQRIPVPGI